MVTDPNDRLTNNLQARSRRRRNAAWKSGLMLTGLGAVVVGAGYLAGVNAPAANQAAASQSLGRTGGAASNTAAAQSDANQLQAPNSGQGFLLRGDDGQVFGDDNGALQLNGNDSDSSDQLNQLLNQQLNGRRSRQVPGFSQQQPGFSQPLGRSRGS